MVNVRGHIRWRTFRLGSKPGIMLPGGDHLVNVSTVPPFEAYQGDDPYVFISYSHKDAAVVYEEITRLHEVDVNVWYDEGIEASNEWPEEIARSVVDCTVFLVFVSPRATDSVNCRNEINLALNENKPFLAIHLEETELPLGLRLRMGDLQAILRYKLPVDRYQKKTQDSLEQLLGKKPVRSRTRPPIAQQTETIHELEPVEQSVQTATAPSKSRRKGLAVALVAVLLIACGTLGYLFLGDDGEDAKETSTATFTPGEPWTVPSVDLDMIWCKPGTFMMGSPESEEDREIDSKGKKSFDETQHQVTLTEGFYLGKYEVTQAQWKKIMGTSPSNFFGERRPVEQVNWTDVVRFCQELTLMERKAGRLPDGWEYALPTEAQWEYACRAGTTTVFSFGDSLSSKQANFKGTEPYGGADTGPILERTTKVGSYGANSWGFFDMHGNVSEWMADRYSNYPNGLLIDPTGPATGSKRVCRGGAWNLEGDDLRSAKRFNPPFNRFTHVGFRLSLRQTKAEQVDSQNTVKFKDYNLSTAVCRALNKPADTLLTLNDLLSLKKLEGQNQQITDLTGLDDATALNSLRLQSNNITDLTPIIGLTKLTLLEIQDNPILNHKPLEKLTELTVLDIGSTRISELIPLVGLSKLTYLSLWNCRLVEDLSPLEDLKNLNTLILARNKISDITPLAQLKVLEKLDFDDNKIEDISALRALENVIWLGLGSNRISDLGPLAKLNKLEKLILWENNISDVSPLFGLNKLKSLDLHGNPLPVEQKKALSQALPNCNISF